MIRYLCNNEIDKHRWDEHISDAKNSLIYAYSWYLDIVSPDWDALILDDYNAVMPLTWKRKLGLKYIYKPLFVQQLGIFGNDISSNTIDQFLSKIPADFKLIDLAMNEMNFPDKHKYRVKENNNYKLDLQPPYEKIHANYSRNCNRNIKKAKLAGYTYTRKLSHDEFIDLLTDQIKEQAYKFGEKEIAIFHKLVKESLVNKWGEIVGVRDRDGILVASGFYLYSKDNLIFLICGSTENGKVNQAMYLQVDEQIKYYAGKYKWYDFSGSNMPGIAYFNSTFGAKPKVYYTLSINRLSLPLKILTGKIN